MLIAEQSMLLVLDPASGVLAPVRSHIDPDVLAAGALLLDLAEQQRLRYDADHIALRATLPISHPLLAQALRVLGTPSHGLRVSAAIDLLATRMAPLAREVLDGMVRRDHLHRTRRPAWWPWAPIHYPIRSLQARNEAITALQAAVAAPAPTLRQLGLLVVTEYAGQIEQHVHGDAYDHAIRLLLGLPLNRHETTPERAVVAGIRHALADY